MNQTDAVLQMLPSLEEMGLAREVQRRGEWCGAGQARGGEAFSGGHSGVGSLSCPLPRSHLAAAASVARRCHLLHS